MTRTEINALKKGDKIKIRTYHFREGILSTTRKIAHILDEGAFGENKIFVRCFGWDRFQLKSNEIIEKIN